MPEYFSTDYIGQTFGCYQILGMGEPYYTPKGQKKLQYICKCTICGNITTINASKVRTRKYKYCNKCVRPEKPTKIKVGDVFGQLTVLYRVPNALQPNGQSKVRFHCICTCGKETDTRAEHLQSGHTTSCGCVNAISLRNIRKSDITGNRYGKLTVIKSIKFERGSQYWLCQCDCGNNKICRTVELTTGKANSCGCLQSKNEWEFEQYLLKNQYHYIHQYSFEDCRDIRKLPFDFAILDDNNALLMLIELQGAQHYYPFTYCSEDYKTKIKNLEDRQHKDAIKEEYCRNHNIPLLKIKYTHFDKKETIFEEFYKKLIA